MSQPERTRILVVDDEEAILETMTFTFEDDYDVVTAREAERGLELLEEKAPIAVVISDQRMPTMTGVEFLTKVYERHPLTTRIILTGFADMDAIVKAINEGHVYAYIAKPWEHEDLKQVVRRAAERNALAIENDRLVTDLRDANVFLEAVMDQLDTGALAVDSTGVVRAANRAVLDYLGMEKDPRGRELSDLFSDESFSELREVVNRLSLGEDSEVEEVDFPVNQCCLRLRIGLHRLLDASGNPIGRVVLFREVSHEPLRREFEEVLSGLVAEPGELRPALESAVGDLRGHAEQARQAAVRSPGMGELAERMARTITALENWIDVDDALAGEDFPDAQVLIDRMRVSMARWPLSDRVPERVTELARRVEAYYESGENPKQHVL